MINSTGLSHIAEWVMATAKAPNVTPQALASWASDAEHSLDMNRAPVIEMSAWKTISGKPETFTVPADGFDELDFVDTDHLRKVGAI